MSGYTPQRTLWRPARPDFDRTIDGVPASTAEWIARSRLVLLALADLVPTQWGVSFHGITDGRSESGDRLPHVIRQGGEYFLIDGHHRMVRTALQGRRLMLCRVWQAGGRG